VGKICQSLRNLKNFNMCIYIKMLIDSKETLKEN